jgi:tetratricopeptide (TPR) repeat protein
MLCCCSIEPSATAGNNAAPTGTRQRMQRPPQTDQQAPSANSAADATPARRLDWRVALAALLLSVVAGLVAWGVYSLHAADRSENARADAVAALNAGQVARAEVSIAELAVADETHPQLPLLRGRLALLGNRHDEAARWLAPAWLHALEQAAPPAALAPLARDTIEALGNTGNHAAATEVADRAMAELHDVVDSHLDRDDLGSTGTPLKGWDTTQQDQLTTMAALYVVQRSGEIAAQHALVLRQQADPEAAERAIQKIVDRVGATVCTGTHRIVCRGVRAAFRDRVLAPIAALRTRIRTERAVELVNKGRFEEAVSLAHSAGEQASDAAKGSTDPVLTARVKREAAQVEYAVRVAWGRALEKRRSWGDAREQYEAAAALFKAHGSLAMNGATAAQGPAPLAANASMTAAADGAAPNSGAGAPDAVLPPHAKGLERSSAVVKALDETSNVLDKLSSFGLGDARRKALHDRIQRDPTNPQLYAELALQDARSARDGRLDPVTAKVLITRAETWITISRKVAPQHHVPRFYAGVMKFIAGDTGKGIKKMRRAYRKGYRDHVADLYLGEALSVVGRHKAAARHWKRAYKHDKSQSYALLRAVESLLASGRLSAAQALIDDAGKSESGFDGSTLSATHDGAQAIAMVHLRSGRLDAARKVLVTQRAIGARPVQEVDRANRIGEAVYNKLAAKQLAKVLGPGEELLDLFYGYTIPVDASSTARSVQCALLAFTTKRFMIVRWNASHDYRDEVRRGVSLAGRTVKLGRELAGDWARLNLGIGGVYSLLDQIAGRKTSSKNTNSLGASTELVIESLDLYDRLRADVERNIDAEKADVFELSAADVVAWTLASEDPSRGRWVLSARRRDGTSPWRMEGSELHVLTDSSAWLRSLLRHHLDGKSR